VELWKGRGRAYDDALDKLKQIVRDADTLKADHVVLTGDLTQLAMDEEFALAAEALKPLGDRLTCIPGNHDRYPRGTAANELYEVYFSAYTPHGPRVVGDVALIPIDSCGPICWPVVTMGKVDLDTVASSLQAARAACKLVLIHHAPSRRGMQRDMPLHHLRDAKAFLRVCAEASVQAVLCGHVHQRFDDPALPERARVVCAGSSTELHKEGYWLLDIVSGQVSSVTRHTLGGAPV
jgi:DNA repair exonuclease SbcCD nuclease subunit